MGILNKKQNKTEIVETIEPEIIKNIEVGDMTYEEYVSKDFDIKMNELKKAKDETERGIREIGQKLKEGGPGNKLTEIAIKLQEKDKHLQDEIVQAKIKYAVPLDLLFIAKDLDRVDARNRGVDLIYRAAAKINEIIDMFSEIDKCYERENESPSAYQMLKMQVRGVTQTLNFELPKMRKLDKESLLKRFAERVMEIEDKKESDQEAREKYNII